MATFLIHLKHLFAVLQEVILRENGCIFYHLYYLLYILEVNIVMYHLIASQRAQEHLLNVYAVLQCSTA